MSSCRLTMEKRHQIVFLHEEGLNISQIAEELQTTRTTVRLWLQRHGNEGHVQSRPPPIRPHVIPPQGVEAILATVEQNPFVPTRQFASQFNCTLRTVRNALHRAGVHSRKPARKILLSQAHKDARVRFARDYRDFDFSHAIFSDEKSFKSSQIGRRHLWRVNNARYEPRNILPNLESGRVVVNMWAWMSSAGPGELAYIPERVNGESYLRLLQDTFLPTVRVVYPEDEMPEIVFIQDNCPIHASRIVQNWIRQQENIRTVPWPSRSPDLNPIENLWGIMVQRWDNRRERTKDALVAHVDQVWDSFRGSDLCEVLVKSMRARCDAVIDAGGALTKY